MPVIFRKPTADDLLPAYDLLQGYALESYQGKMVPPDSEVILETLVGIFGANNFMAAVARLGDDVVGIAFGYVGRTWWRRKCGGIDMFYIDQRMRGTSVARGLVQECLRQFEEMDCGFVWASSQSGMGEINEALFNNLFLKYGFVKVGGGGLVLHLGK